MRETRSHSARKALWDANENNKASVAHITVLRLGCELQQFELQSKNHRISDFLKVPTGRAVFECI